jgi:hypothetical protein
MDYDGCFLWIGSRTHQVTDLVLEPRVEGARLVPTIRFSNLRLQVVHNNILQRLFQDLWNMGLRPQDGTGNMSHVQTLTNHLDDMKKIAFRYLDHYCPKTE